MEAKLGCFELEMRLEDHPFANMFVKILKFANFTKELGNVGSKCIKKKKESS